jgi:hypothetical protein
MNAYLSRRELAERWKVSHKTIDRLRFAGKLSWVNLASHSGKKPLVRFKVEDVEAFERAMRCALE